MPSTEPSSPAARLARVLAAVVFAGGTVAGINVAGAAVRDVGGTSSRMGGPGGGPGGGGPGGFAGAGPGGGTFGAPPSMAQQGGAAPSLSGLLPGTADPTADTSDVAPDTTTDTTPAAS